MEELGASEEEALRALLQLAQGTLSSIQSVGVARAMPGPVSRRDLSSIELQLDPAKVTLQMVARLGYGTKPTDGSPRRDLDRGMMLKTY